MRDELFAPVKADKSDSIVVDVPLGFGSGVGGLGDGTQEGMFRATEHGHSAATGYLSRLPLNRIGELAAHRFYTDIIVQQLDDPEAQDFVAAIKLKPVAAGAPFDAGRPLTELFPPSDPRAGRIDARKMGVGWVVIWPEASAEVRRYVRAVGFRLEHRIDGIALYRAPAAWRHAGDS